MRYTKSESLIYFPIQLLKETASTCLVLLRITPHTSSSHPTHLEIATPATLEKRHVPRQRRSSEQIQGAQKA